MHTEKTRFKLKAMHKSTQVTYITCRQRLVPKSQKAIGTLISFFAVDRDDPFQVKSAAHKDAGKRTQVMLHTCIQKRPVSS